MWKFISAGNSGGHPLLRSLNDFRGRQTWEFEANAGSPDQLTKIEQLRANFTKNRFTQRHSSDELLRLQCASKIAAKQHSPPTDLLPDGAIPDPTRVANHLKGAISFYECLQQDDGHFPGDYGGPMFLFPGMLITLYTIGHLDTVLSPEHKQEAIRYLRNHQNEDGGFGLHIEGGSTMFGTTLK